MTRGSHCSCCVHYRKHWKVEAALMPTGWYVAWAPTDDEPLQPTRFFRSEGQAVEYARFCRDNPRTSPGSAKSGHSLIAALQTQVFLDEIAKEPQRD